MRLSLILPLILLVTSAWAADTAVFRIDPEHTQVEFAVKRFGFTSVLGVFPSPQGEVTLDEKAPDRSSVHVLVQTSTVDTNLRARDKIVQGALWLDAAKYPTMSFTSTKVTRIGASDAEVAGDLTLHGESHPIILRVHLNKLGSYIETSGTAAGFSATTTLARSRFGMKTALGLIGDEVTIRIEALAVSEK